MMRYFFDLEAVLGRGFGWLFGGFVFSTVWYMVAWKVNRQIWSLKFVAFHLSCYWRRPFGNLYVNCRCLRPFGVAFFDMGDLRVRAGIVALEQMTRICDTSSKGKCHHLRQDIANGLGQEVIDDWMQMVRVFQQAKDGLMCGKDLTARAPVPKEAAGTGCAEIEHPKLEEGTQPPPAHRLSTADSFCISTGVSGLGLGMSDRPFRSPTAPIPVSEDLRQWSASGTTGVKKEGPSATHAQPLEVAPVQILDTSPLLLHKLQAITRMQMQLQSEVQEVLALMAGLALPAAQQAELQNGDGITPAAVARATNEHGSARRTHAL
eukprot:gnl/TRDRNA2_/TRDRNA2_142446_c0_seq2.p1 gnl/TRDRNA2_/TRDRNA2_142446_c0~~gnl/TRDRNA2_/TRDRNA2_142446_c0_seq2.p1  ORF type:complete len:320 (+),score=43.68 gnl/TRDRNA2_/TRDRNA2_142446_c0_seq2:29-988(+)